MTDNKVVAAADLVEGGDTLHCRSIQRAKLLEIDHGQGKLVSSCACASLSSVGPVRVCGAVLIVSRNIWWLCS